MASNMKGALFANTLQDGPVEQMKGIVIMGTNKVEMVRDTYDRSSPAEPELIAVVMGRADWEQAIKALNRAHAFAPHQENGFIADSIQDVLSSL